MIRKIIYIALVLFAFHILAGFNIARIPQWFKGIWEYNSGKFISAIGSFEKAQDGDSDAVMQYNKGAAKYRDSDFKAAEEDFTKASETNPQFEPAYYNQGNARVKQGKLKEAVESYEKALEIDPDDEDARHNLEYVKKLLEQKNNTGDNADSQSDQQRQNPQASDKEGQSTKDKGSEELKGKEQQEKKNSDQKGEASGGQKQEQDEKSKTDSGSSGDETEEKPNLQDENKQNLSGLSDETIERILDSLAEEEKALAGKLQREQENQNQLSEDPFGVFNDLWSIAEDLDPFATQKHKKRDPNEIDW